MSWSSDPQPVPQPAPGPASAGRRPRTWLAVVLTAAVMLGFGVSFAVGVVTGFVLDDGAPTTAAQGPASGGGSGGAPPAGGSGGSGGGSLDPCLVGTWTSTEHVEDWTTDQGEAELSGVRRTMTFTADGTQTVSYDQAEATVTALGQPQAVVFDGEVVYRTSTDGGTMSFQLVSVDGSVTVGDEVEELEPGTGAVSYTCDDSTLRQEADGYLSVYERTG
jgi:hypothetical protein